MQSTVWPLRRMLVSSRSTPSEKTGEPKTGLSRSAEEIDGVLTQTRDLGSLPRLSRLRAAWEMDLRTIEAIVAVLEHGRMERSGPRRVNQSQGGLRRQVPA